MTRQGESAVTFELDGTYVANATNQATVFTFDLGDNETRTYYTVNGTAETIYVFKPVDPYYTYFFEMLDYVGLSWGYLESVINVGGNDRVVERWSLDIVNDIPFVFTWGKAYTMRLVCDRGEYTYGAFVAGASTSFILAVTSDMFPVIPTDINGLTVLAGRRNVTWIQCYYHDIYADTNWTCFKIFEYGESSPIYTYNSSSQTITLNWYEAGSDIDYYVSITVLHNCLGLKYWSFPCPTPVSVTNPFDALSLLGSFPFAANQVPAVLILVVVMVCFSWYSLPFGMIVDVVVAAILVWLGWLDISWAWLSVAGSVIMLMVLSEAKQREIP